MPKDESSLITSAQAALILGCSARTIHRRVDDRSLTPVAKVQAGRHGTYLFRREDIERLAEERKAGAA